MVVRAKTAPVPGVSVKLDAKQALAPHMRKRQRCGRVRLDLLSYGLGHALAFGQERAQRPWALLGADPGASTSLRVACRVMDAGIVGVRRGLKRGRAEHGRRVQVTSGLRESDCLPCAHLTSSQPAKSPCVAQGFLLCWHPTPGKINIPSWRTTTGALHPCVLHAPRHPATEVPVCHTAAMTGWP
jgi:hypothetical protein